MDEIVKTKPFAIEKEQVWQAYKKVRNAGKAPGIDGMDWQEFEQNLSKNLYKIWNRLSSGSYMAPMIKEKQISKPCGGKRTLGIPTVGDRIAQMVVKTALEAKLEPIFLEESYGFRPKRSAHDAIKITRTRCWKYDWVLDVDIKSFFDTVDHELLMKAVRYHAQEKRVILYIERWIKASRSSEDGTIKESRQGIPQGGVISPILANLYLHYAFDMWMKREYKQTAYARYADDIIIHCNTMKEAKEIRQELKNRLRSCNLDLHPDKTKIIYCQDEKRVDQYKECKFKFLGYDFRPYRCAVRSTGRVYKNFSCGISKSATKRLSSEIRRWKLHKRPWMSIEDIAKYINPITRGWQGYYGIYRKYDLKHVYRVLNNRLVKWARKKYKHFKYNGTAARKWLKEQSKQQNLFAHWQVGFNII